MKKSPWKRIAIASGIGIAIFLLLMLTRGGFSPEDPAEQWRTICDALFVPGIILMAVGLMLFAADGGVFDMLKFGLQKALSVFMTRKKREGLPETFYDYKEMRDARPRAKVAYLLVIGAVFIVLAALALVMYNQYDPVF